MDLSIAIVNWNTQGYLTQCLRSIQAAGVIDAETRTVRLDSYTAEVLIVDNASADQSVRIVQQDFPWVRLIQNPRNVGFAPANNQAIGISTGRYVLLLNSDTEVRGTALQALVEFMDRQSAAGAAGAYLLNADGSLQPSCQPMITPWREFWRLIFLDRIWQRSTYPLQDWNTRTPHFVEVIKGACMIVRRTALDQVGLLDEQYFFYTEEVDLCYRLLHNGWTLHWVPWAQVVHYGEASSKQMAEAMYVQLYRSKVQFYRKTGGDRRARLFKCLVACAYVPRLVIAEIMAALRPQRARQTRAFHRLLTELPTM